ncbi:T9SS type A sorting domain-containing protein [candidate division KSB1 bacterium]|nr:T9SS type A sorting domain-containing protein [candidate division KSB1 bacterium]
MRKSYMLLVSVIFILAFSSMGWTQVTLDPNLAFGANVFTTASNTADSLNIADNDLSTVCAGNNAPFTFDIDLGEAKEFDFVGYMSYRNRWHSYVLIDTDTGDTLVDRSTNEMLSNTFIDQFIADTLDTPVTAQNLQLVVINGSSGWKGCAELVLKKLNGVYNAPLPKGSGASAHSVKLEFQLLDETPVDEFQVFDGNDVLVATVPGDAVEAVVGSLADGFMPETEYQFSVHAIVNGQAFATDEISVMTLPRLTNLSAAALSANSVELTWTDNAEDEDGYQVWQKVGEEYQVLETVQANSYMVTGLMENTAYTFAVAPVVNGQVQAESTVDVTTMLGATDLQAMRYSVEAIELSFSDNGATNEGLWVLYSEDQAMWDTLTVENKSDEIVADTVMVQGLKPNTTYYFMVQPFAGEEVWTASPMAHATTFPWMTPVVATGSLVDEDFSDGMLDHPRHWEMPGEGYDIMTPNLRDADFALARRLAAGGDTWSKFPVWGKFRDRNNNGIKDPGEYVPHLINTAEDVVVLKARHYSDIVSGSTEYYNINARVWGPRAHPEGIVQVKLNYNTKGKSGYGRQVHPMVNGEQYPVGAPSWQLPPTLAYGNFGDANDSTLSVTYENLILYRPEEDTLGNVTTNVETWTQNNPGFEAVYEQGLAKNGFAAIDHVGLLMVRPALRSGILVRDGVADKDAQLGLEHFQLGITKKADFNIDYRVDVEDFFAMASGWGQGDTVRVGREIIIYPKTMLHGDGNNDGVVDASDFEVLKEMWNKGTREEVMRYKYDAPKPRKANHELVAEVNIRTGMVTLRGTDSLTVVGYKLVSPSGGFAYYPASPLFKKGLKTFTASEISEANNASFMFTAPSGRGGDDRRTKPLGRIYNTDINPRDVQLVWQDDFGGETMIGGVTYIDMEFDGIMSVMADAAPPDTSVEMTFAHYTAEKDRRNVYWNDGGGRDMGQQFIVESVTTLDKITMAVFPHAWGEMVQELDAAQDDGCFMKIVKTPSYENSNEVSATLATYYGNLPSVLDTLDNRFITFDLPGDGIVLEPLEGDSTYGFLFGFVSPKDGRVINFSITHPYKDSLGVDDYMGGSKIDFTWKQNRDIDGGYKYNPQGWKWGHQTTFWLEASHIGGPTAVERDFVDLPTNYDLAQNYPNPFNPTTTITFSLPEPGEVKLSIYDITGRLVKELVDDYKGAGIHNILWDARDNSGYKVASGVYLYRLETNGHAFSRRMMLLK